MKKDYQNFQFEKKIIIKKFLKNSKNFNIKWKLNCKIYKMNSKNFMKINSYNNKV